MVSENRQNRQCQDVPADGNVPDFVYQSPNTWKKRKNTWTRKHSKFSVQNRLTPTARELWQWLLDEMPEGGYEIIDLRDFNKWVERTRGVPHDPKTVKSATQKLLDTGVLTRAKSFTAYVWKWRLELIDVLIPPRFRKPKKKSDSAPTIPDLDPSNAETSETGLNSSSSISSNAQSPTSQVGNEETNAQSPTSQVGNEEANAQSPTSQVTNGETNAQSPTSKVTDEILAECEAAGIPFVKSERPKVLEFPLHQVKLAIAYFLFRFPDEESRREIRSMQGLLIYFLRKQCWNVNPNFLINICAYKILPDWVLELCENDYSLDLAFLDGT